MNETEILRCMSCGRPVGVIRLVEGVEVLQVGAVLLRSAHGVCQCGYGFHWDMGERALARLISHVLARRSSSGV
jgi:hypothetical protein